MKNIKSKNKQYIINLLLVAVGFYLLFIFEKRQSMEGFDYLVWILYILCVLLRIVNTFKQKKKALLLEQKQLEEKQSEEE